MRKRESQIPSCTLSVRLNRVGREGIFGLLGNTGSMKNDGWPGGHGVSTDWRCAIEQGEKTSHECR